MSIAVSMMVIVQQADDAVRVGENLSRACIGLALEGYSASISFTTVEDEFKEEDKS